MVNILVPRKKPAAVNTLVPRKKPAAVNTLVPKKKTKTKEELAKEAREKLAKEAREKRINAIKAKRAKPGSKFRKVRASVLKPTKSKMGAKGGAKKKKREEEDDLDDFIVNDSEDDEYYEAETDDEDSDIEAAGDGLTGAEKKRYLEEKEKYLEQRRKDRKGDIEALLARLEAKAVAKAKKKGESLPSDEAFEREMDKCPELKKLKAELASIKAELAQCRAQKCKRSSGTTRPKQTGAKPLKKVSPETAAAARKLRIQKLKEKRAKGKKYRELKPCSAGYVRNPKTGRCGKIKKEKTCPTGKTLNEKTKRCVSDKDSHKVKFAKALISSGGGSSAMINEYFKKHPSSKLRLKMKTHQEAFKKARKRYYKENPEKKPKRKSAKSKK